MQLPVYRLQIDPDLNGTAEVNYIALVDKPAIEKDFQAFSAVEARMNFTVINNDRRIISGPAMLADTPIYRNDAMGEYMVVFDAMTIYQIAEKFFAKGFALNFNAMHDPNQKLPDIVAFESFIVDETRGIQPMKGYEDVPQGSWFVSAKVSNDTAWQGVIDGTYKGFSVEGIFQYMKPQFSEIDRLNNILSMLQDYNVALGL